MDKLALKAISDATTLTPEHKAHLQEIAALMLQIYETLVEMRYFRPEDIIRGPHTIPPDLSELYKSHTLDPAIIYLYTVLPRVSPSSENSDFFQGGTFFDQCKVADVERGRDPFYASPSGSFDDEEGQYMYPWYTPLSNCGNHSPLLVYDARNRRIWVVDQIQRSTTDPMFSPGWYSVTEAEKQENKSDWGDSGESNWTGSDGESEDESVLSSDGSSEFWEDHVGGISESELTGLRTDQAETVNYDEGFEVVEELEEWERQEAAQVTNRNSLEPIRSRPAVDVLRDINRWYRELKELPGQGEHSAEIWRVSEVLKQLYIQHGWPDHFDGDAFEIDLIRKYGAKRAEYYAEEPLRRMQCFEDWSEHTERKITECREAIANTTTATQYWSAKFKLCQAVEIQARNQRDLEEAYLHAQKMCPDGQCQKDEDLPLWELEQLRLETEWKRQAVERGMQENSREDDERDAEQIRSLEDRQQRNVRCLAMYERALEASSVEAARLCPGRTFEQATGIKTLGYDKATERPNAEKAIQDISQEIQSYANFLKTIPPEAEEASVEVREEIGRLGHDLAQSKMRLRNMTT